MEKEMIGLGNIILQLNKEEIRFLRYLTSNKRSKSFRSGLNKELMDEKLEVVHDADLENFLYYRG